jgi:AcrR family transcriptional regulator
MDEKDYRTEILNSALALVKKEGLHKLTVTGVVKHCGISSYSFYKCYTTREELLQEIIAMLDIQGVTLPNERQVILEKAEEWIPAYGFNNITLEGLGSAAGLKRGTIYKHFNDKYELLESCIEYQFEKLKNIISTLNRNAGDDPEHFLWNYIENYSYFLNYSMESSLCTEVWSHLNYRLRIRELTYDLQEFTRKILTESVWLGIQNGIYKSDLDVEHLVEFMMITLSGMGFYLGKEPEEDRLSGKTIHTIIRIFMEQLKSESVRSAVNLN